EQLFDVKRVKDAVRIFTSTDQVRCEIGITVGGLKELVQNISRQIAFGQVHRLFHGGYFSSNLSINGELLDFGSFRSLPDWGKSFVMDHVPPFGDEMRLLALIIESLVFH
ncbi:MchC protein, partial [mine drainage metagenome]